MAQGFSCISFPPRWVLELSDVRHTHVGVQVCSFHCTPRLPTSELFHVGSVSPSWNKHQTLC